MVKTHEFAAQLAKGKQGFANKKLLKEEKIVQAAAPAEESDSEGSREYEEVDSDMEIAARRFPQ